MIACVACGKGWEQTKLYKIPSYCPDLGACGECILKYGVDTLAHEADKWMAEHFIDDAKAAQKEADGFFDMMGCFHCGGPVVLDERGYRPLWCMKCHKELEQIRRSSA